MTEEKPRNRNGISTELFAPAAALALKNARALRAFRSASAVGERDAASTLPTRAFLLADLP